LLLSELPHEIASQFDLDGVEPLAQRIYSAVTAVKGKAPTWLLSRTECTDLRAEDEGLLHSCGLVGLALLAWERLDETLEDRQQLDFSALEARAVELVNTSLVVRDRLRRQYRVAMID